MQQPNLRPEPPASFFPRPLRRARYVAGLLVVALVVCGKGALHRRLSTTTGPSRDELPLEVEKLEGTNDYEGERSKPPGGAPRLVPGGR